MFLDGRIIFLTLHPQVIYWGAVFLLGLDVVDAADSTAEDHREHQGQDLDQEDGCQYTQHFVSMVLDKLNHLVGTALYNI